MLLKDKTVVIFGGSGAIGRAAALAMAKEARGSFWPPGRRISWKGGG